ncbi:hypothetical protein CH373_07210 [Leptospira perolatii]|uniref:Uncharacterized protein n=1 Tax=Leptospira perolatii TaxID=2023191 RepID=A0A2M9ZPL4_9LEPT|nr:hypothetical protein CH360_04070 [Leptospira perolatii]PJZ73919.1 hypothetical protein CH373_07210 [Leptospira perolatii]
MKYRANRGFRAVRLGESPPYWAGAGAVEVPSSDFAEISELFRKCKRDSEDILVGAPTEILK